MKMPEFIIEIVSLSLILIVCLIISAIIMVAKLLNLVSEFILDHLASQEFRER
ncbi:hypothetical protein ES708_26264 [subsurface metagenome]